MAPSEKTTRTAQATGSRGEDNFASDAAIGDARTLGIQADVTLVRQCVAGDVAAWEYLVSEYQGFLTSAVGSLLRAWKTDVSAAEDVVARTWLALVDRDGELLTKYDPSRGVRLRFFLLAIAKDLARRYVRTETRHTRAQNRGRKRRDWCFQEEIVLDSVMLSEFWNTLSEGEQAFFAEHLTPDDPQSIGLPAEATQRREDPPEVTDNAAYCFRHRIRKKLLKFFGFGEEE